MQDNKKVAFDADEIPSLPGVALRLLEIFDEPDVTIEEFAEVISADPALTVKIIDYCNSPIIGRTQETTNLQQAVLVLGLRAVKMIALSFSLIQTKSENNQEFDYGSFWNQSLATALVSKLLFEEKSGNGDDAFLIGLMLNIGLIVMACSKRKENRDSADQAEIDSSTNYYQLGGSLLEQWNFPEDVCRIVGTYNRESINPNDLETILGLADSLSQMLFNEDYSVVDVSKLQAESMILLGLDDQEFEELFEKIMSEWSAFAKLLSLETGGIQSLEELELRARKSISKLSLGLHLENQVIQEENDALKSKVNTDELTGLKNRRAYNSEVHIELERAKRMNLPFCLMVIDIDFFKIVNDTYGHAAGDKVLVEVVNCLTSSVRSYDSTYRFGGEEFAIMLFDCDQATANLIADRIRLSVEAHTIDFQGEEIKVTVSVGAACLTTQNPCKLNRLFELADGLLYKAKSEGRNCCRVSTNESPRMPVVGDTDLGLGQNSPAPETS